MKSEKGITLTSLIIYVLAMTIIMAIIGTITIFFYRNVNTMQDGAQNSSMLTRFNQYMEHDMKDVKEVEIEDNKLILKLKNNEIITYTYVNSEEDKGVYRNQVKICNEVQEYQINKEVNYEKTKLKIHIKIGENEPIEKDLEYTVQN